MVSNVVAGDGTSLSRSSELADRLREFARAYSRLQEDAAASLAGVSVAQCHVLSELHRSEPIALTELSRRLEVDKGWVSRTVDALEEAGMVERSQHASDRRLAIVSLTRKGRGRAKHLNQVLDEQATLLFERLKPHERQAVAHLLDLLLAALKDDPQSASVRRDRHVSAPGSQF